MYRGNEIRFDVVEHIATLSESSGATKELNRISYNGAAPKLDLRSWKVENNNKRMLKGLTLTNDEAKALRDALNRIDL